MASIPLYALRYSAAIEPASLAILFVDRHAAPIPGCVTVKGGTLNLAPGTTFACVPGKTKPTEPYTTTIGSGVIYRR